MDVRMPSEFFPMNISVRSTLLFRPKWPSSEPHEAAIAKTPAKWFAYHIPSTIVVFAVLVRKSHPQKPQEALNLSVTEECYWALFYTILSTFLHSLLTVTVQTANEMVLKKLLFT
jgi:hypothetical protein